MEMEQNYILNKKNTRSRIGCTVCKKKNTNSTSNVSFLSHKKLAEKKKMKDDMSKNYNGITSDKNVIKTEIELKPKKNECYCNYMELMKRESYPKLVCSQRFKTPNLVGIDKDWLNEIKKFRHENWFDCHADSLTHEIYLKNIIPQYISKKQCILNCNCQNNSISTNYSECNVLKTENSSIPLKNPTSRVEFKCFERKPAEKKFPGKKRNLNINIPWKPPST